MDQSSSSFVLAPGVLKRKNNADEQQQERRAAVGEMDFFETEMRREKRDRKDAGAASAAAGHAGAVAGAEDDLGIMNKGDLGIDVSNGRYVWLTDRR
jgi:hypothetical protein